MRIYVIGHNTWLGQKYINEFKNKNIEYVTSDYEVDSNDIVSNIAEEKVTHVIYCLGYQSVVDYGFNLTQNVKKNLYGPVHIAMFCHRYNIHFTYIGTGDIYDYDDDITPGGDRDFNEEDDPNYIRTIYHLVKGQTDRLIKVTDSLNLRIRRPITDNINEEDNHIAKLLKNKNKVSTIPNSYSVLDELIPISLDMIDSQVRGTFNFTNPGKLSDDDILEMYKKTVDPELEWKTCKRDHESNATFDVSLVELSYKITPIQESLGNVLARIKEN